MSFNTLAHALKSWIVRSKNRSVARHPARRRMFLEGLEDRSMLASYSITDLGFLGGTYSNGWGINEAGQVVGTAETSSGSTRAFLWQDGTMINLGTLGTSSQAQDINESGQIVGLAFTSGAPHAYLLTPTDSNGDGTPDRWFQGSNAGGTNSLMVDLGTLGGTTSAAAALNDAGHVTGSADTVYLGEANPTHAFRWSPSSGMSDLGGAPNSIGRGMNNAGLVAGSMERLSASPPTCVFDAHAVVFDEIGGTNWLGELPGHTVSRSIDINESGQVVGSSGVLAQRLPGCPPFAWTYKHEDGFLWHNGVMTSLGAMLPTAINNSGQVVGEGFLWESGTITDLNSSIDSSFGWSNLRANDINDRGQIVGTGVLNGRPHAILLNPDTLTSLAISDVTVNEVDTGTIQAFFTITRSGPLDQPATVTYATVAGTAGAGSDFTPASGIVTFAAGDIQQTIGVVVHGDSLDEVDETFSVSLSGANGAVINDAHGQATIVDNDAPPALSISDVAIVEGPSGVRVAVFTVSLSAASGNSISVNFATANGTAKTGDNDYVAASGTLTFNPGETTKTISVQIKGDKKKESNETFFVNLSNATNALLADSQGVCTILNDD